MSGAPRLVDAGALVLSIVVVVNVRKSRFGRVLIALRESEQNVAAFGIDAVRMRLAAFAFSGALAGFAGASALGGFASRHSCDPTLRKG